MKLLILLFIFSLSTFAKKEPSTKLDNDELNLAVSTIKEKQIERQILESNDLLKECKEKHSTEAEALEKCVIDKFAGDEIGDEEIEKLADKLELGSYDKNASKSVKSIKDYLSDRVHNALRGESKKKVKEINLKDINFVDHALYARLYRSQVGKNILLETTNYCVTSFGLKDNPTYLASHCSINMNRSAKSCSLDPSTSKIPSVISILNQAFTPVKGDKLLATGKVENKNWSEAKSSDLLKPLETSDWTRVYEYEICDPLLNKEGT